MLQGSWHSGPPSRHPGDVWVTKPHHGIPRQRASVSMQHCPSGDSNSLGVHVQGLPCLPSIDEPLV